jgi:hypothetical protein
VVFSFRVSIPGVALAAGNDTYHCTASRSGSMFETKSNNGYVTNAPVPKTELVDCSQWDVEAQAWRNKSRGGHCEMTAFDCDSGRATCTCKHLTDFAALFKYNFRVRRLGIFFSLFLHMRVSVYCEVCDHSDPNVFCFYYTTEARKGPVAA